MKTKRVTYYIALAPGWQSWGTYPVTYETYPSELPLGYQVVKVEVDLPEVPQLETITATVKEITP